jgi:hypothetical protein
MTSSLFSSIRAAIASRFSRFTWSTTAQSYAGATGRIVPPESVRVVVDKQIAATGKRLEKAGEVLKAAKGSDGWEKAVRDWQAVYREELRALELQSGSLGNGGLHAMDQAAYERIEARVAAQFEYHDAVVQKLLDDPEYVESGRFAAHADGYSRTARHTYENEKSQSHLDNGFPWIVRWQHSIKGCPTCGDRDGVVVRNGTYGPLGSDCECGPGCDCTEDQLMENPDG